MRITAKQNIITDDMAAVLAHQNIDNVCNLS